MPGRRVDALLLWMTLLTLLGWAVEARTELIPARAYQRHYFTEPGSHEAIQAAGNLSGGRWGIAGWVEYGFNVDQSGWYQLSTRGDAPAGVEFAIDAPEVGVVPPERYFYQREYRGASNIPIGNIWLAAGSHRIRLTRYFWTGFPRISAIELRRTREDLTAAVHVYFPQDQRVFRAGECPRLVVHGGAAVAGVLEIIHTNQDGSRNHGSHRVSFTRSDTPSSQIVSLACTQAGFHRLAWRFDGQETPPYTQPPLTFQVIDTRARPRAVEVRDRAPLVAIDCARRSPDYASGDTRIRTLAGANYRESAASGWIPYQRADAAARARRAAPSWFAYALPGVTPQQRLRVEVDYPDDAPRTFAVAWRDAEPLQYVVARAVETGREHRLTSQLQTLQFNLWPRASRPRLVFQPAHDGDRAACIAIRIYADDAYTPGSPAPAQGRRFLNWYEEGEHFTSLFGAPADDAPGFNTAVERWLMQSQAAGVNTLMPTVSVYNFGMYPSAFNRSFSEPQRDTLRVIMLQAERFGMTVIPELHPRADELAYARDGVRNLRNLALSRDGRDNFAGPEGRNVPPYFNALDAGNQAWYIGMIRELADRYRDSPAFEGVSLRYMSWANPALNNLASLDWGYDDATVARYRRDTGSRLPEFTADAARFSRRHDWLLENERSAWIQWRCRQVTTLFTRIRDALRELKPDLNLYLHLFGPSVSEAGQFHASLEEAGIDLPTLTRIEGLVIVNSSFTYGRLEQDGVFFNADRDPLLDPGAMLATPRDPARPWILPTSRYLEAIGELVVPPPSLGFPESTRAVWMSAASDPPGRRALERYAVLLAQTDAIALGDGGNNLTLVPGPVAQFAREFRKLPAAPFAQEPGAVDPVTVRSRVTPARFMFYAVNREDYPVGIRISLTNGQIHQFELKAYELRVLEADFRARIAGMETTIPPLERARVSQRIRWVQGLVGGATGISLSGGDARVLGAALATAQRALQENRLWQARTALETSAALRIFRTAGCFAPDMRAQFPDESRCKDN